MTETLQLEPASQARSFQLHQVPHLLVEWSSPWQEFRTSIRPALARSTARLAGEAPYGLRPYRGMVATWAMEVFLLFVVIVFRMKVAQLRPYAPPRLSSHDVIYYSGDELPRTEDLGGAHAGVAGSAGGNEARHHTQTIRISRGGSRVEKVVDAPNFKLPASRDAVANLLAIKPNPGPPPLEGLRNSRRSLLLPADVIAPAPAITRDYTRGVVSVPSVIPPAPSVSRDNPLTAPSLGAAIISPAPQVSREHSLVAPKLDSRVIAPAPSVARERARSAPALSGTIIPPAPSTAVPEISRSPVQMTNVAVVPPPVSSPERETSRTAKLTMPAPSVIAPPPSADMSRDLHRLASGSIAEPSSVVVPPPPAPSGNGGLMGSLMDKIFGATDVIPPPPRVSGGSGSGSPRGTPGGTGAALGTNVVPPPPSVSATGASNRSNGGSLAGSLTSNVVPPPPSISASGRGTGHALSGAGGPGGTLLAGNVVPPPPSVGGGASLSGSGRGGRGSGLGGPLDTGSALAPPGGGGSGGGSGVVVSNQPGSKVGIPGNAGTGSLAMSPTGSDKSGLGGAGGGSSIGHGNGPGSGMTGEGTGAGKVGTGQGSDPNARSGISPTPGPGGAGSAASGNPPVPGVAIRGGSSAIVNLPSFGSVGGSSAPVPQRSSVKAQQSPAITIVATARSGGAFNRYGELPGDNYTVYFDTSFGPASMQFADPNSAGHPYGGDMVGPQPLRADLPAGLPRSQITVRCVLDSSGNFKVVSLLESGPPDVTVKVLSAISHWKFRPAMHGDQPVLVNAILGFNINTDDRF